MTYKFLRFLNPNEYSEIKNEIGLVSANFGLHETFENYSTRGGLRDGRTIWLQQYNHREIQYQSELANTIALIKELADTRRLGRFYIHRLEPGQQIYDHVDGHEYHSMVDRFHIYLDIEKEVIIKHNGPVVLPWSIIQFDLHSNHSYENKSKENLDFIVFDLYK